MMIKKSPWIAIFNSGECKGCGLECIMLISPKYDVERFGCLLKASPRHADILLVTGVATRQSKDRLKRIYSQMAPNKKVLAIGSCAISGGIFRDAYNMGKNWENSRTSESKSYNTQGICPEHCSPERTSKI